MKLYLNLEQMKLFRTALYGYARELKSALEKGVTGPVLEVAEQGLQEIDRFVGQLNEEIRKEES